MLFYRLSGDFHQQIFSQRAPPTLSFSSYKTSNYHTICAVWCMMRDAWCTRLFFCKILTLWVKGGPKILHLGSFRPFDWYSKIDPRWQSYVHFILQVLFVQIGHFILYSVNTWQYSLYIVQHYKPIQYNFKIIE